MFTRNTYIDEFSRLDRTFRKWHWVVLFPKLFPRVSSRGVGLTVGQAALKMLGPDAGATANSRMNPGHSDCPVLVGDNFKLRNALPELDLHWVPTKRT